MEGELDEKDIRVKEFDPNRVRPLPDQPRKRFRNIPALARSIKKNGQWKSGIVSLVKGDPLYDAQLWDGERRLRGCKEAGVLFRAEIRPDPGDVNAQFVASFGANFGQDPHDCIETAHGLKRLQDMGKTHEDIADICGMSTAWVSTHLKYLELSEDVQQLLIPEEPKNGQSGNGDEEEAEATRITLPTTVVPLLLPLPAKVQRALAFKIVREGMSQVAAQRLVIGKLQQHGVTIEHKKRIRRMKPLQDVLDTIQEKIGIYRDLQKSGEFKIVLEGMDASDKRVLVETINALNDDLSEIADDVEKDIAPPKKPQRR